MVQNASCYMKILFLAHRIPYPPNKGDKIRSFHELRALAERGHEVHLLAFADDPRDLGYQVDLAKICAHVEILPLNRRWARFNAMRSLLGKRPLSLGFYTNRRMQRAVASQCAQHKFDAIVVYSSTMAQYVPRALALRTVVDLVDADSEKWRDYADRVGFPMRQVYRAEWQRLRQYEHEIVSTYAHTMLTTPREAQLLNRVDEFTRHARLRTLTNGVDLQHYRPEPWRLSTLDKMPTAERQWFADPSAPRLVFTGAMDYYANIEGVKYFVEHVLPLVHLQEPRAEFMIVGSNPTEEVQTLGRHANITVTGFVNDVRPYLQAATVCIAPLRIARGVQNKVLEAMAAGKAIVATAEAVAGLHATDGEHLLIGKTPPQLAHQIVTLIRDDKLRTELGEGARGFVEDHHDWEPLLQRFAELVEGIGARHTQHKHNVTLHTNRQAR
jgi:sugar transferase (PEP-CTERM/EpsH1 system associated)